MSKTNNIRISQQQKSGENDDVHRGLVSFGE